MDNWLETNGAPFIVLEKINAGKYNFEKYYNTICSVKDYIGIVEIENSKVIVLADDPMALKIVKNNMEIYFLRWGYAPDKQSIDEQFDRIDFNKLPIIENISFAFDTKDLVLFDSGMDYNEADIEEIIIPSKNCIIKTFEYRNENTWLIIHKMDFEK